MEKLLERFNELKGTNYSKIDEVTYSVPNRTITALFDGSEIMSIDESEVKDIIENNTLEISINLI